MGCSLSLQESAHESTYSTVLQSGNREVSQSGKNTSLNSQEKWYQKTAASFTVTVRTPNAFYSFAYSNYQISEGSSYICLLWEFCWPKRIPFGWTWFPFTYTPVAAFLGVTADGPAATAWTLSCVIRGESSCHNLPPCLNFWPEITTLVLGRNGTTEPSVLLLI